MLLSWIDLSICSIAIFLIATITLFLQGSFYRGRAKYLKILKIEKLNYHKEKKNKRQQILNNKYPKLNFSAHNIDKVSAKVQKIEFPHLGNFNEISLKSSGSRYQVPQKYSIPAKASMPNQKKLCIDNLHVDLSSVASKNSLGNEIYDQANLNQKPDISFSRSPGNKLKLHGVRKKVFEPRRDFSKIENKKNKDILNLLKKIKKKYSKVKFKTKKQVDPNEAASEQQKPTVRVVGYHKNKKQNVRKKSLERIERNIDIILSRDYENVSAEFPPILFPSYVNYQEFTRDKKHPKVAFTSSKKPKYEPTLAISSSRDLMKKHNEPIVSYSTVSKPIIPIGTYLTANKMEIVCPDTPVSNSKPKSKTEQKNNKFSKKVTQNPSQGTPKARPTYSKVAKLNNVKYDRDIKPKKRIEIVEISTKVNEQKQTKEFFETENKKLKTLNQDALKPLTNESQHEILVIKEPVNKEQENFVTKSILKTCNGSNTTFRVKHVHFNENTLIDLNDESFDDITENYELSLTEIPIEPTSKATANNEILSSTLIHLPFNLEGKIEKKTTKLIKNDFNVLKINPIFTPFCSTISHVPHVFGKKISNILIAKFLKNPAKTLLARMPLIPFNNNHQKYIITITRDTQILRNALTNSHGNNDDQQYDENDELSDQEYENSSECQIYEISD